MFLLTERCSWATLLIIDFNNIKSKSFKLLTEESLFSFIKLTVEPNVNAYSLLSSLINSNDKTPFFSAICHNEYIYDPL